MKMLHKINNSKEFFICTSVFLLCVVVLITMKITENNFLKSYFEYEMSSSSLETAHSTDLDYYNNFIGLPNNDLFEHLESNFWEVLDDTDNYTTYQSENGHKITIYYNETQIIESIDFFANE